MLGKGTRVKSRRCVLHPLLVLLLSLLLVGGQQAALAHMLGHATTAEVVEVVQEGDVGHDAALVLSHTCTTCLAFAGADAAPPVSILPLATASGHVAASVAAVSPAPTLRFVAAFRSRAPPPL
jgi:dihydroorotase